MNFDEETLIEIEDYINALDESVGLYVDTLTDIENAIKKQRKKLKNLTIPVVSVSVCSCDKPHFRQTEKGDRCFNCNGFKFKQTEL